MNINSTNWNLIKVETFEKLYFKRFFIQGMTYEQHTLSTVLTNLHCFHCMNIDENMNSSEYIITFNSTTTRAIFIKQPQYMNSSSKSDYLDKNLNLKKETINDIILRQLQLNK